MLENLAWLPFGSLMIGSKFPRRLSKFLENLEWTLFDVTQGASLASSKVQSLSLCVLDICPWCPLPGTLLFHILALFFSPINLNVVFVFFFLDRHSSHLRLVYPLLLHASRSSYYLGSADYWSDQSYWFDHLFSLLHNRSGMYFCSLLQP